MKRNFFIFVRTVCASLFFTGFNVLSANSAPLLECLIPITQNDDEEIFGQAVPYEVLPNGEWLFLQVIGWGAGNDSFRPGESVWPIWGFSRVNELDEQEPIPVVGSGSARDILVIGEDLGGFRYIGAGDGLFRLTGTENLEAISPFGGGNLGAVTIVGEDLGGFRYIGATEGLFKLTATEQLKLISVTGGGDTGQIDAISESIDGYTYIGAENGLFRLTSTENLEEISPFGGGNLSAVSIVGEDLGGFRYIGAAEGLFKLTKTGQLQPITLTGGGDIGQVNAISEAIDDLRYVGTEQGVYQLEPDGTLKPVPQSEADESGPVWGFQKFGSSSYLVQSEQGLFKLNLRAALERVEVSNGDTTGRINEIGPSEDGKRLVRASDGLFRMDQSGSLTRIEVVRSGELESASFLNDAPLHIGRDENGMQIVLIGGLFYRISQGIQPSVISNETRTDAKNTATHTFEWLVEHECAPTLNRTRHFGVRFEGNTRWIPALMQPPIEDNGSTFRVELRQAVLEKDGVTLEAVLGFRETKESQFFELNLSQTEVRVNWGVSDYFVYIIRHFGFLIAGVHAAIFTVLFAIARKRMWAWNVITDPWWGKIGGEFWFFLRHIPRFQRWMLVRWSDQLKTEIPYSPYLPMPLKKKPEYLISSDMLPEILKPGKRIWLHGPSGMGKTSLLEHIVAQFNGAVKAVGFEKAFAQTGYVPFPITLREFASLPVPAVPELWIFGIVKRRFEAAGLPIEDELLLRGIVNANYFLFMFDGENEVDDQGAIAQFAMRYPRVGLLITSQSMPSSDAEEIFSVLKLPDSIEDSLEPLLELLADEPVATRTYERVRQLKNSKSIRSGYDVRLIADLIQAGTGDIDIPKTREDLYEAILATVHSSDYPESDLAKIAFESWVEGTRSLVVGTNISLELLEPLRRRGVQILRPLSDTKFQFRHDQMRAYLSAKWLALEVISPVDLFEEEDRIWSLGRSEQQSVWEFFANLIDGQKGSEILDWAVQEAERAELQVALRRVSERFFR